MQLTGTLKHPSALKDISRGIFFSMLIIMTMYYMPLIGIFAWIVLPLPVLFYRLKIGRNGGAVIMGISLMIMIILTRNIAFNAFYFGSLLITGMILGECIEQHLSIERIMIYTAIGLGAVFTVFLFLYAAAQSQGIEQIITNYVSRYQSVSHQLFLESAQLYPDVQLDKQLFERASRLFMIIFPGIILCTYLSMALINILMIRHLLNKNNIQIKSLAHLNRWKAPDKTVFALIVSAGLMVLPSNALKIVCLNCLIIMLLVYFYQGIAIVSYFFEKKKIPFVIKSFVYILVVVQPLFMLLIISFGLFDTWINFRRLDTHIELK
jgi:uncharacterized protein YybS (DUF2232 family)